MSIAPPSDVVLDVAQAADPQKVRAATARLVRLGAGGADGAADFTAQLAGIGSTPKAVPTTPAFAGSGVRIETHKTSPYEKFEAMMLQNFIETILPKDSDLFGDATSADAYRSMLAGQLATDLAKTGRLGIARAIEHAEAGSAAAAQAHARAPSGPGPSASLVPTGPAPARPPA